MELKSVIIILTIFILSVLTYIQFKKNNQKKQNYKFLKSLNKFNQDRLNPLSPDQYRSIYEYENNLMVLLITEGKVGSGNQRDGDELMENSERDSFKRISQHLNLSKQSKICSLGYDFKKQVNLLKFLQLLSSSIPNNTHLVIPINQTWLIIEKHNQNVVFSLDTKFLGLNQIFNKISV